MHLRRQRRDAAGRGGADPQRGSSGSSCRCVFADASTLFLDRLAGVVDPEQKRKIIGATFIDVFEDGGEEARIVRFPRAGHAVSGRDRERVGDRAVARDQEPPQRRRAARAHALQAGRAAAAAVQGRSARGRQGARAGRRVRVAAAVSRDRAWRCGSSARSPRRG